METLRPKASTADLSGLRLDSGARASGARRSPKVLLIVLGAALLVAIAAVAAVRSGAMAPEVVTGKARLRAGGGPSAVLTANGYVVAQRKAAVASKATGRLAELFVEEGSVVRSGDILGRLEHADYDAEVARTRAAYEAGVARLAHARRDSVLKATEYAREEKLLAAGMSDQAKYDRVKADYDMIALQLAAEAADIRSQKAALELAQANQEYTNIRAPFDATVLRKNAEVGEIVAPISVGGTSSRGAIVDLADMSSLEVEVDVNESYIARIEIGQGAVIRLDAYPEKPYAGRVRQIVPTADRQKATVVVKVAFDALDRLVLPEMGAKVTFQAAAATGGEAPMRVYAPKEAIVERDGRSAVLTVVGGKVQQVAVERGEASEGEVEIRSGLRGGETLLLSPPAGLEAGARVRVKKGD